SDSKTSSGSLFMVTNTGTGIAIEGINNNNTSTGAGIKGIHNGSASGYGVFGLHNGKGSGVYGTSVDGNGVSGVTGSSNGYGVYGSHTGDGPGIFGTSEQGLAALFTIKNPTNLSEVVSVKNESGGDGLSAWSNVKN